MTPTSLFIVILLAMMTGLPRPAAADRRGCATSNLRQVQACLCGNQPEHYGQQTSEEYRGDVRVERLHPPDSPIHGPAPSLPPRERQNKRVLVLYGWSFGPIHVGFGK